MTYSEMDPEERKALIKDARERLEKDTLTLEDVRIILRYQEEFLQVLLDETKRLDIGVSIGVSANMMGTLFDVMESGIGHQKNKQKQVGGTKK